MNNGGLRIREVETYKFIKSDWDVPPLPTDQINGDLVVI